MVPLVLFGSCKDKDGGELSVVVVERKDGMVKIPGGTFKMGSDGFFQTPFGPKEFPEEAPVRTVHVEPFWIDETEVTNRQFAEFVEATGYTTFAEREASLEDFPEEAREFLPAAPFRQGSVVFSAPDDFEGNPNEPGAYLAWWRWDPEANWRQPEGEGSSIKERMDHPVVCVTMEDAKAYAEWAGKRLPKEAEWEFAARGGLAGKMYVWGNELKPGNRWMANTFQGEFPANNTGEDGFISTAPVKSYPPNGYGLYDMAGNAWEMCEDFYDPQHPGCCAEGNPEGPDTWMNRTTGLRGDGVPHYVTKGGSFLCHISYCMRYRPAARHSAEDNSPANHTGFRCVRD